MLASANKTVSYTKWSMFEYTSVFFARPQKAKTISVEERNVNVANAPIADSPVIAVI